MEKSYLQQQAELSRFDDGKPKYQPTPSSNFLDSSAASSSMDSLKQFQNHPDADWAGNIKPPDSRKHFDRKPAHAQVYFLFFTALFLLFREKFN
jgi:hypothetical protein